MRMVNDVILIRRAYEFLILRAIQEISGLWVSGSGFQVSGFGFWVSDSGLRVSGFRFRGLGLGSGFGELLDLAEHVLLFVPIF